MKRFYLSLLFVSFLFIQLQAQTFTNYTTVDGLLSNNVNCLTVDAADDLWFGTQAGVSHFNGSTWVGYTKDSGLVDNNVEAILIDSNGDLWAGTSFGLTKTDFSTWTTWTSSNGLGSNQVKALAEDASGNIWVGTNLGLSRYDGANWTSWSSADGLPFGGIASITPHSNGKLWLGSALGGVIIFDGTNMTTLKEADGLVSDKIRAVAITAGSYKWVGTADGITVLDWSDTWSKNHTRPFILPQPDTLNPIEDIKIDGLGRIWAGIYVDYLVTEGGISMWDGYNWTQYEVSDGLIGPVVRQLAIDSQDNVWIATSTGVSKLSNVPVGLAPEKAGAALAIWPNPATGRTFVGISREFGTRAGQLRILDLRMQVVKTIDFAAGLDQLEVDLQGLQAGIYFLRMGNQVGRVVVE
ncbi:MAG: hypothetical protein H6581_27090 [Bacteroidia bacterium]|nr:hypothetical protein [Bacteroidia bacterium]